ncbi:unnamed protein product [Rotaria magnacalcarata]|uniref:Protein kinase domain-containing protein n=1 Tax=Rotaria magnacalcarata TaxID=392030 RepID=A0A819B8Z8_9BILA|nr:unnamed protein product [Rotaria magnacalcarata]CAF1954421.1 unnamed protein product [Rotaria magnacalcarata]CAF2026920.1 unnamed protein product [Rotaria magnacalcarata]CAF2027611.1 unnamed protein product [Rotaria magnacalcarata]CAF3772828.1 unnamed protein product [Rotaria magnacalcarata]
MSDGYGKLADFGFSKNLISESKETSTFCGTLLYVAPEIFQKVSYSFPVDYLALGIMIDGMIEGITPFFSLETTIIEQNMINDDECPNTVSSGLPAILKGLLIKDPSKRFGYHDLESSDYYSSQYSLREIEKRASKCPLKMPIRSNPPEVSSSMQPTSITY